MGNIPIRFKRGQGLELTAAEKTQGGLLALQNAEIDLRDTVAKRRGAPQVARTTTADPDNEIPVEQLRALWHRDDELVLETQNQIHSRLECSGAGTITQGTATSEEILAAISALNVRNQSTYDVPLTLPAAVPPTAAAHARLNRKDDAFDDHVYTTAPGGVNITARVVQTEILQLTWDGAGVDPGSFTFPGIGISNIRHTQISATEGYVTYARRAASGTASRSDLVLYLVGPNDGPPITMLTSITGLDNDVLGTPATSAYDTDQVGVISLLEAAGVLVFRKRPWATPATVQQWQLSPGDEMQIRTGTDGYVFDGRADVPAGKGPRAIVVPRAPGVPDSRGLYYEMPAVPTGNQSGVLVTVGAVIFGDVAAIDYDTTDEVLACRVNSIGTDFSYKYLTSGSEFRFNDVIAGVFSFFFSSVSNESILTRRVNGVDLSVDGLATPLSGTDKDLFVVADSEGKILFGGRSQINDLRIHTLETPGVLDMTLVATIPLVLVFELFTDGGDVWLYAHAGTEDSDHIIEYSTDSLASFTPLSIPIPSEVLAIESPMSMSADDLGLGDIDIRATQWYSTKSEGPLDPAFTLHSYSYDTSTGSKINERDDTIASIQFIDAAHVQLGLFPRILWVANDLDSGKTEVYEIDIDLFVRVFPTTVALAGGNWTPRGPWTRGRYDITQTQDWGDALVRSSTAALVTSPATGDPCILELLDITSGPNQGVNAIVYSTHPESGGLTNPAILDPLGRSPHISSCTDVVSAIVLTNNPSSDIVYDFWQPGDDFSFLGTGITAHDTTPIYDLAGGDIADGTKFYGLIARDNAAPNDVRVQIREDDGTLIVDLTDNLAGIGDKPLAVAIYNIPGAVDPTFLSLVVGATAGGYIFRARMFRIFNGFLFTTWSVIFADGAPGEVVRACTCGALLSEATTSGLASIEVQDPVTGEWEVRTYEVESLLATLTRTDQRSSIFGSYVERNDGLQFWQSSIQVGQQRGRRNGIFGVVPRTGEIITRTDVSLVEDFVERANRDQVSDANIYSSDRSILSWQVETGAVLQQLTASRVGIWDVGPRPHRPGVIQEVAIGAHGGYPRAYDSTNIFEQDWHELPQIDSVTNIAGALTAGSYGVAVTYESTDAQNLLYRTSPAFDRIDLVGAGAIQIETRPIQRTERHAVRAVAWRTLVSGSIYYRVTETDALVTTNKITFGLTTSDASIEGNEILDQVIGGFIPSESTRSTTFMAVADGRLWTRDPQRGALIRFSTFAQEGRAPYWNNDQGLELPSARPATAVSDADGRIIAWSTADVSTIPNGGPSITGVGGYPQPSLIPSATGCDLHESVALTPDGHVYGTGFGPFILTRGLQTSEYIDAIYAPYERDGESADVIVWRPDRKECVITNGGQGRTFRLHPASLKWAEDVGRAAIDMSVSLRQEVATLVADGRILVERPGEDIYTDGESPYRFLISTPWIHQPAPDQLIHGGFVMSAFTITGDYMGSHELQARIYFNYSTAPTYSISVPATTIDQRQVDGLPYVYHWRVPDSGIRAHSMRIEISDNTEPNASMRISAIDISITDDGSPHEIQFDDDQSFMSPD